MVCRLIVVVGDHKTDTAEEQNAVESTYPTSPLVVFAKICGGYDFLEERALHKFLHEDGSLPRFLSNSAKRAVTLITLILLKD